jgi:hypothetical protein
MPAASSSPSGPDRGALRPVPDRRGPMVRGRRTKRLDQGPRRAGQGTGPIRRERHGSWPVQHAAHALCRFDRGRLRRRGRPGSRARRAVASGGEELSGRRVDRPTARGAVFCFKAPGLS